ncbi:tolloid-like protein 1, partial [Caerostris darwini]
PCGPSALQSRPEAQTLTSINYPNQYPVNIRCSWVISRPDTNDGMRRGSVQLTVNQLDVPCNGDYLEIQKMKVNYHVTRSRYRNRSFQRRYMATPLKLCGSTPVHDIIAPSGLTIFFHSDAINNTARGFSISYKDANCSRVYTAEYGIISNSEYPGRYNTQKNCAITITTTPGKTISAYFSRMEMYSPQSNCAQTKLKVFDGQDNASAAIGSYCGYDVPNPIFSSGNSLYIESTMQHSIGLYYLIYMATDQGKGCGGSIYAEEGVISSPLYPQAYKRNSECVWHIKVPGYHTVKMEFNSFHLNSTAGCDSNYVELYDGATDQIADRVVRYCGTDHPGIHISKTNEVTIKFKSDSNNEGPGFLLAFTLNEYLPVSSLHLIQRYTTDDSIQTENRVVYL